MLDFNKDEIKAYSNGFGIGVFVGIVLCIFFFKTLFLLPVVLGLLFGAIAFEHKIHKMGQESTREYRTKERVINEGSTVSEDPRIDSPEIKVTYPAEEVIKTTPTKEPVIEVESIPRTVPTEQPKEAEAKEEHTCTITPQKAVEQNWIVFGITSIVLIGIGVAIGKSISKSVMQ